MGFSVRRPYPFEAQTPLAAPRPALPDPVRIEAGPRPIHTLYGVVAIVGCDGTGKTTLTADLVAELMAELGRTRPVVRRYMGLISGETGDRIKHLPVIGDALEAFLAAKVRRAQDMERKLPGTLTALVMSAFSLWRVHQMNRLRLLARQGVLVIAERYPQAEIPGFHFDGPGLAVDRSGNALVRRLAGWEQGLYERMACIRPGLVVRLTIDAPTAHARKPDHPLAELRTKIDIMPRITYNGADIIEIDACRPYHEVLETALGAIRRTRASYAGGIACQATGTPSRRRARTP